MNRSRNRMVSVALAVSTCVGVIGLGALTVGCESQQKSAAKKSLYDRLGGEPAIRAVVDDFVGRAAGDPKVNFTRKGVMGFAEWQATPGNVDRLKMHLVTFIGSATGGPQKYAGRDMVTAHTGMLITDAEFAASAANLQASLDHLNVPKKEAAELMAIVASTRTDIVGK